MNRAAPASSASPREDALWWIAVGACSAVGLWLRIQSASSWTFHGDDFGTHRFVLESSAEILGGYSAHLTMHLYLLLLKPWVALAGSTPAALIAPSAVAGAMLVPLIYAVGRGFLGRPAAATAAALAALNPLLIQHSQSARVYALLTVWSVLAMGLFRAALQLPTRPRLLGLALFNAFALALSLNAGLLLSVQALCAGLEGARRKPERALLWIGFGAALLLSGLLALLFYSAALPEILAFQETWRGGELRWDWIPKTWSDFHPSSGWLFAALVGAGAIAAWRHGTSGRIVCLWASVPFLQYALMRTRLPEANFARFLVPCLPAHLLLAGAAVHSLAPTSARSSIRSWMVGARWALTVALLCLCAGAAWTAARTLKGYPYPIAFARMAEVAREEDLAMTGPSGTEGMLDRIWPSNVPPFHALTWCVQGAVPAPAGRLLILAHREAAAESVWQDTFTIEVLSDRRYELELVLLWSRPISSDEAALRRTLYAFLEGYAEGSHDKALSRVPFRNFGRLHGVHTMMAELAAQLGWHEISRRNRELAEGYRAAQLDPANTLR